jgi:general secretion pathway protein G
MRSIRAYEAVAVQKLGEDGRLSKDDKIGMADLIAAFDSAPEKVDGDTGTLDFKEGTMIHFKKGDGLWKINLGFLDGDPEGEAFAKALPDKARVLDAVKDEIAAGKYPRARNALDAVRSRLVELSAESPVAKVKAAMKTLKTAIELYKANVGEYPPSLDGLVKNVAGSTDWKGPYVDDKLVLIDPWGHPYKYMAPGAHNTDGFDLWSAGDGKHPAIGLDNWSGDITP